MQEVKEESESGRLAVPATSAPARRRVSRTFIAAAALLAVGVAAGIWFLGGRHPKREALMVMTRLTSDSGLTTDATISPDGKLVAYASDRAGEDNLDIWLQQVAGGAPIRLTSNQADDREPAFSPDGSRIAFRSEREGGGIYIVSTLGGEERMITKNGRRPRFSPDGNSVAYYTGSGLRSSSIYIVSSTGGSPRELKLSIPWATEPVWSPDGKHLLFKGSTDPTGQNRDWWVASPEGGHAIQTGAAAVLGSDGMAGPMRIPPPQVWAGDHIVFSAGLGDASNLFRIAIKPDTLRISDPPERLTTGASYEWGPSLSTDGRLVFTTSHANVSLWTLAIDLNRGKLLGKPEQLTPSGAWSMRPTLSSDGKRLAFLSERSGTPRCLDQRHGDGEGVGADHYLREPCFDRCGRLQSRICIGVSRQNRARPGSDRQGCGGEAL